MNRFRGTIFLSWMFLYLTIHASTEVSLPEAKLTIKVLDDDGRSLSNMPVHVWLSETAIRDGQTDSNGLFVAEGPCTIKDIPISITKQGYYDSRLTYSYPNYVSVKDHKWQPWNPVVTAVVRQVVNPIPMNVKKVEAIIPATNSTCGYDLETGDWVAPYGKGTFGDLVFRILGRRVVSWTDCEGTLSITFSNEKDGFQMRDGNMVGGSGFPWSYMAPDEGYSGTVQVNMGYAPGKGFFETNQTRACYFRVRSVTNTEGKVVSAYYGKIPGPLKFDVREGETGWVGFTYYFNPTPNDRNLEFDPKRNLFKRLKSTEYVTSP